MKALKLIVFGMALFLAGSVQAQVSVSVNVPLPPPPPWGPAGYAEAHYYYLPDVEAYYDVESSMFIYYNGGAWVHRTYLPSRYRNYDLYNGYKVVMTDYHGNAPYAHFKEYKKKYTRGYRGEAQRTIGERPVRGKSGSKISHQGNHGNKGNARGNGKSAGHGNSKNMKKDHGGENGKNK